MSKRIGILLLIVGSLNSLVVCSQPSQRGLRPSNTSDSASTAQGQYYALIIGNQNYKNLKKLQTPINDANEIAQLLRERYGFQSNVLLDASRDQILDTLNEYRRTLPKNSSLLIYFAGHGYHDPETDEAYWLPIDAERDSNSKWISANDITSDVKAIPSAHILIISDSCYSGYIVNSRSADVGINPKVRDRALARVAASKSRNLMSSGGDEPVADNGAAGHSVFAAAVLDSLRRIGHTAFPASELFQDYIQPAVGGRSGQLPQYSAIRNSGHEFGDFVFTKGPLTKTHQPPPPSSPVKTTTTPPRSRETTLSVNDVKVMIVEHDFFDAYSNPGGGAVAHPYKVGSGGGFLTVLDTATGLMWERGGSLDTIHHPIDHQEAAAYVKALNARKAGGYGDWRLPTLEEAMSLMVPPERGQSRQTIDGNNKSQTTVFHIDKSFEVAGAFFMWTADRESAKRIWVVYFGDGYCSAETVDYSAYVRAVRSNR